MRIAVCRTEPASREGLKRPRVVGLQGLLAFTRVPTGPGRQQCLAPRPGRSRRSYGRRWAANGGQCHRKAADHPSPAHWRTIWPGTGLCRTRPRFDLPHRQSGFPVLPREAARLAELGYVEGKNLIFEQRFADCRYEPLTLCRFRSTFCPQWARGRRESSPEP
jgi:hypothetical protein